ncbi:RICIN domain-containing protein [Hymenobacter amundsenii]|nr:RICIN domain-containing protein [Hymenobacter amundsenii]
MKTTTTMLFPSSTQRWGGLLLLVLLLSGFSPAAVGQSMLRARGPKIVNASGQEVVLNGVNLGGWLLQEGYIIKPGWPGIDGKQTQGTVKKTLYNAGLSDAQVEAFYQNYRDNFITRPDIDYLASLGFNCLRLPLHYDLFLTPAQRAVRNGVIRGTVPYASYLTSLQSWYDADELFRDPARLEAVRLIDSTLTWAAANKMYVVFDLHAAPGSQGTDANIADALQPLDFWYQPIYQDMTVRLWATLARRYKNDARVAMYDLLNEPNHVPTNQQIHAVMQRLISAVRAEGDNHLLLLEGNGYGNDFNYLEPFTFTDASNLVYNSHRYSGTGYLLDNGVNSTEPGANNLRFIGNLRNFRTRYSVPIWVGETGENTDAWMGEAGRNLNSVGIGWCHWTYKRFEDGNNAALLRIPSPYIVDGPGGLPQVLENIRFRRGVSNTAVGAISPNKNGIINYPGGGNYDGLVTPYAGPPAGRRYQITARHSGKVLGIQGASLDNAGRLQQQMPTTAAAHQQWELRLTADGGFVRLINVNSRRNLDIVGPSVENGVLVYQYELLNQDSQYWQVLSNFDGTYRIVNKYSLKALDVLDQSTADGALIQQYAFGGGTNQRWQFTDLGPASGPLATANAATEARLQVYPTVADAELRLYYTAPASQHLTLSLLDLTGRVVARQPDLMVRPGENPLTLPVAAVRSGVYLLRLATPTGTLLRRVVVAHE